MDSLLASYASSDDEADEAPPTPAASQGGQAGAKPASSSSSGGGIFSSLPQTKSAPLFSALPAPKSGPAFSALPPPKSAGNPKRFVQYRPQPIRQPTGDSSDDEEDEAQKRRAASAGSEPVSSFLPPPSMLSTEQVTAEILMAMRVMRLGSSMPRMEENKGMPMLIHKEVSMQMWRQRCMEQIMLEGMAMRRQRQQHSLQCNTQ